MNDPLPARATRRRFLLLGGAAAFVTACGSSDNSQPGASSTTSTSPPSTSTTPADRTDVVGEASALTAADFESLGTCVLLPEKAAGPFPLDEQFDRRDITEGYPGHPLRLGFRVVDERCAPVGGAAVEIWHTDATGDYSAFTDNGDGKDEGAGTTFLRGTQTSADDGIVEFLTVYPGWYPGRAVHIHLRVHLDDTTVVTSQVFFDADHTASVYAADPYAGNGLPDTSNERDSLAGDVDAEGTLLHLVAAETDHGTGTLGLLNLGIEPGDLG